MMRTSIVILVASLMTITAQADDDTKAELEAYWQAIAKTVRDGDAAGYRSLYHADAVVVMVESGKSFAIDAMMETWTPGFESTAAGKMKANVVVRLEKQIIGDQTAWESGIFHYWTIEADSEERRDHYARFESLFVKKDGKWLQTMELQRKTATVEEWDALKK